MKIDNYIIDEDFNEPVDLHTFMTKLVNWVKCYGTKQSTLLLFF